MLFEGRTIKLLAPEGGIAELKFERVEEAVNKLDALAFQEFRQALDVAAATAAVKGLLVTSGKENFIVGADIFEFTHIFKQPEAEIEAFVANNAAIITSLSDLPVPSLAAIQGLALGGGFEVALGSDYRVMAATAKAGFPEIHLGIFPGYGGTVRLPRLIGLAAAADWILTGAQQEADRALQAGAVDAVSTPEELRLAGLALLRQAIEGPADWRERRARLKAAQGVAGEAARTQLASASAQAEKTAAHFPAGRLAVQLLEEAAELPRDDALALEAKTFAKAAKTQAAESLVTIFINEQALKKNLRRYTKDAPKVERAAVLGAGIMGGGIAYQSALRGVPIVMKDVSSAALEHGLTEARKLLAKSVEQGRLSEAKAGTVLSAITPELTYEGFDKVDVVIEAIVEEIAVKHRVLREIESFVRPSAILCSNTSSLRIADLAAGLERPENFLGMHFFNPVPRMPLVEVVHGPKTSQQAIATVMGYAAALGKTPILVADCPGFVVNRVLTP
ncbi:MAG TPA: 3-hydroxyacyl-CoA dehydrogenase NAD-binding domain-containing protein, partial [Methylocella sp.]|nr:3-hydroxyacyl-CoA dehydrogenase NAD-binding domain-containing protein [Methylocella sp.]